MSAAAGYNAVGISSTYRDSEAQNALYAKGRTKSGAIVTNARAGQSIHNYRLAFDIFKNISGHLYDDPRFFKTAGELWTEMGGEWGGSWKSFPDAPHMEYTGGLTLARLQAGERLPDNAKMLWELIETAMTQTEFNEMFKIAMDRYLAERADRPASDWAASDWGEAVEKHLFDGTMPQGFMTREQCAAVLNRFLQVLGKRKPTFPQ
jgi:hypothetical protein